MDISILIAGVGGQGTLFTSRVLGQYAMLKGNDCKLSEVHGMAQRGGSVVTYVRLGEKIYSPVISQGSADIILAFEKLEALRYAHYLKKEGIILVNTKEIMPLPVITGTLKYPTDVLEKLQQSYNTVIINAQLLAIKAGEEKTTNTVMLGKLTKLLNLDADLMLKALKNSLSERLLEINLKAFNLGYNC